MDIIGPRGIKAGCKLSLTSLTIPSWFPGLRLCDIILQASNFPSWGFPAACREPRHCLSLPLLHLNCAISPRKWVAEARDGKDLFSHPITFFDNDPLITYFLVAQFSFKYLSPLSSRDLFKRLNFCPFIVYICLCFNSALYSSIIPLSTHPK